MVIAPDATAPDRRTVLRSVGAIAAGAALAGCTTSDGGDGGNGGDGGDGDGGDLSGVDTSDAESYASASSNYDGPVDRRDQDEVSVAVGAEGNGSFFAFDPPLVVVSTGTTVTWEWTGDGGGHNVIAEDDTFDSGDLVDSSTETFEYTFSETGTYNYYCQPHEPSGMVGSVVVV